MAVINVRSPGMPYVPGTPQMVHVTEAMNLPHDVAAALQQRHALHLGPMHLSPAQLAGIMATPTFGARPGAGGQMGLAAGQRVPLGLGVVTIGAGSTGTLSATAQVPMVPERLVLQDGTNNGVGDAIVTSIFMGAVSCTAGTSGIAAATFADNAIGTGIAFASLLQGNTASVGLSSTAGGDVSGTLIGQLI